MAAVTRADVARRAGVSPAVVSYVLNGGPRPASIGARARVLEAVDELEYHPNSIARSLRLQATKTLGVVVPDTADPYFAEIGRSIENAAYAAGYMLLLGSALDDGERQARYVRTFLDHQVAGLAIVPSPGAGDDWLAEVKNSHTALVVIDRRLTSPTVSSVMIENQLGSCDAVNHLIEVHGRGKIACLAGPADLPPAQERLAGWISSLRSHGLPVGDDHIRRSGYGREQARSAARDLLTDRSFDAIFVTSDEQALGVLRAAAELGRRIPDDLALMSFDGIMAGRFTTPTLATVRQPFDQIGRIVAELLLDGHSEPTHRRVSATLVPAESCGCAQPGLDPSGSEE